jgi:DNA-binding NarL/FixJ family response regulator
MSKPTVLLADDHRMVAEGLIKLLGERFEITETVNDGSQVLDACRRRRPDVVILDISMPGVSGLEAIRQLKTHDISSRIIVLTMFADPALAVEALRAGALGFVLKESSGEELLTAIDTVMNGVPDPERITLTTQQREVLRLIVRGLRAKEVATTLNLSPRTIVAIKQKLMQSLHVQSTAELVRFAVEHRLVPF